MLTNLNLGNRQREICGALFDYLFGRIGKYRFRSLVGDKELAKQVWLHAGHDGYILKNCKLFAYAYHYNKRNGLPTSPSKYGILQEDVAFLKSLNLSHIQRSYKPYSLFDFEQLEAGTLATPYMDAYVGRYISKKMRFILKTYGQERSDLKAHMLSDALFALRKHYPVFKTELHALNICKTSISNSGNGLIDFYTRKKRNALINTDGDFQTTTVDFSTLHNIGESQEQAREQESDLRSLVKLCQDKLSPRARKFVEAAAGVYDPGFSLYLGLDNRDAADRWDYERYLNHLRDYHAVTPAQQESLLLRLRTAMR